MATIDTARPNFEIGRVLERTFGVLGRNLVTFFGLALLIEIPNLLMALFLFPSAAARSPTPQSVSAIFANASTGVVAGLVGIVLSFLLQAAIVYGTIADLNGKRASFTDCLATGARHALPLAALGVLSFLGMIAGFVLLIVPGIILALSWSQLVPVRVVENTPIMDTFGRSAELTRGHRWAILGLYLIYLIVATVLNAMIGSLTGRAFLSTTAPTLLYQIAGAAVAVVTSSFVGTMVASMYFELRKIKEGVGAEHLAAVFD